MLSILKFSRHLTITSLSRLTEQQTITILHKYVLQIMIDHVTKLLIERASQPTNFCFNVITVVKQCEYIYTYHMQDINNSISIIWNGVVCVVLPKATNYMYVNEKIYERQILILICINLTESRWYSKLKEITVSFI